MQRALGLYISVKNRNLKFFLKDEFPLKVFFCVYLFTLCQLYLGNFVHKNNSVVQFDKVQKIGHRHFFFLEEFRRFWLTGHNFVQIYLTCSIVANMKIKCWKVIKFASKA